MVVFKAQVNSFIFGVMRWLNYSTRFLIFVLLTLITQIGGLVYILALWVSPKLKFNFKAKQLVVFCLSYILITYLVIPPLAKIGGRVPIQNDDQIQPVNYFTVLLNRNYVTAQLNESLKDLGDRMSQNGLTLYYLDANFPFVTGFPLLPHLSHNDGKKVDLALVYEDQNGSWSEKHESNSGYGVFVEPKSGEVNTTKRCLSQGYLQYDFPKYLTLGKKNEALRFSVSGTKILMRKILKMKGLQKVFVEPHLKQRMNLTDPRIRFQGCHAVRHDDHIHLQVK